MIKLNFTLSELCIFDDDIPMSVADKLLKHIRVIQPIREKLGVPISASENSGYRPIEWELKQGRSGNSEHCFKGLGAVDWTCSKDRAGLIELLKESEYKRVAYYPENGFIHCDFKGDEKLFFLSDSKSNWKRQ
jgi:hypothetical protein